MDNIFTLVKRYWVLVPLAAMAGCGGGGGGPAGPGGGGGVTGVSGDIFYKRHRNVAGQIAPVLSEDGSGFDGREVDSPMVAVDGGRVAGDKFMLYYEGESSSRVNTIGLVTSNEEDFVVLTIQRTLVIGLGPANGPYEAGATDPTVVVDKRPAEAARRYKMWFEGRSGAGGVTSTIMYCVSADGVTWTGFTPCTGLAASFGSVRTADPSVVLDGGVFKMWFEAINSTIGTGADGRGVVGYAVSNDGVNWTIKDAAGNTAAAALPVFTVGPSGRFDAYSVNAPGVVLDTGGAVRFHMWYEAGDRAGNVQSTIGYATSADGLMWTRATLPVFGPSSDFKVPLPFDSGDLEHPTAALVPALAPNTLGHFLLWYTGDGEAGASPNRIGLAKGKLP